jgi:hypothetical protein
MCSQSHPANLLQWSTGRKNVSPQGAHRHLTIPMRSTSFYQPRSRKRYVSGEIIVLASEPGQSYRLRLKPGRSLTYLARILNDNVLYHSLCGGKNKADVISPTAYQTDGAKPSLRFAWERMPPTGGGSNDFHQVLQSGPRGHRSIRDQNQPERF